MGDGNSGYRVVVVTELGGEEAWPILRRAMFMEMQVNGPQYLRLYLSSESLDESMFRIGSHIKGPSPFIHWFDAPLGLYSAATFLNIASVLWDQQWDPKYNCLIIPVRRTSGGHGVNKIVHICRANRNHFIQLLMNNESYPLPPVHEAWRQAAHNSCRHLERHFHSRINL